jgi:hypothetical protein
MTTNRSIKTGLATLALVGAVTLGGAALTPVLARAKSGGETYSHAFRQATAGEVLAWMRSQGIDVQVGQGLLPEGRMSFAFDGMKRDELVRAFGTMVGLRTVQRDGVYSLLKGVGGDGTAERLGSEDAGDPCPLSSLDLPQDVWEIELPDQDFDFDHDFDHDFDFDFEMFDPGQDVGRIVEEVMKALEEAGVFSGKALNEEQKQALQERLHERLGKMHGMRFFAMPKMGQFKALDPEHMKRFEEQMKMLEKEGKLSQLDKAEMEKAHEAMRKAMEEMQKSGGFMKLTPEQIEKMRAEGKFFDHEAFQKRMEEMHKGLGENMKVLQLKLENVKKFIASLTPEQKALADKQGYLRPEDLTKEQRELLGIDGKGDVNMSFSIEGQKVVIKSKGEKSERKSVITA